jgi:serine/threonine protein kinase
LQRTISRYVLLEQVGSSGLATVYKAQDPNHDKFVALKVLRPFMSTDEALLDKFSQDMERVAKLSHPNILPVYGKENVGDTHWVAMEYASWPTLRHWLQQPIPATQAMMILRQVAAAIEAAQLEGIYHGDIKPGNIFLDPETGHVMLSDFGITMLGEGAPPGMRTSLRTPLATYTAPEQGQGSTPNAISDIYSLGVLAYDMLTGTVPFNALDRSSVQARQLISAPPIPSEVNPNIPQQLDAIILKALAPHPERRYQTAGEFIAALAAASPLPEENVTSFRIAAGSEPQTVLPGMEPVGSMPLAEDRPMVICTICGHNNYVGATWCTECWGVLNRMVTVPGKPALSWEERAFRRKKSSRIRRSILGSGMAAIGVVLAVQFLNITLPLPTPSSTISSESGPGEWAMIHRSFEGSGVVPGESADIDGRIKWTFETGDPIVSNPAIKDNRVYLSTQDNRVLALDASTGDLIWEHKTVTAVQSSPAVAGDMVFFGARNRKVIALDAFTGNTLWEFATENNPTTGSPIVKDGVVYIGSGDGRIYALDALTGTERWSQLDALDWITNTPALSDNILVVSSLDGWVRTYDTNTGKKRFSFSGFNRLIIGSPIIMGETIYVPYQNGLLASMKLKETEVLFQSRWYRGALQLWFWGMIDHPGLPKGVNWVKRIGGTINSTPAVDENNVYVPTEGGRLHAIDRFTGKRLWIFDSETDNVSMPTLVEDVLLLSDSNGALRALDRDSGKEQWSLQIAEGITSTPVLAGGTLYLASEDGTLYAVE